MSEFKLATYHHGEFEFLTMTVPFESERIAQSFADGVAWAKSILYTGDDNIVMVWVLPGEEELMRSEIIDYCMGDEEENIANAEKAFGIKLGVEE